MSTDIPNDQLKAKIQGDVLAGGMPKKSETFFFFNIATPKDFVSSLLQASVNFDSYGSIDAVRKKMKAWNEQVPKPTVPMSDARASIAFTFTGLQKLDDPTALNGALNTAAMTTAAKSSSKVDAAFVNGMEADVSLCDPKFNKLTAGFKTPIQPIHGVFLVAGSGPDTVSTLLNTITTTFGSTITEVRSEVGKVRAAQDGHEHFGFEDGISQPTVANVGLDNNGIPDGKVNSNGDWNKIPQSKVLIQDTTHALWMQNGSFLVFRKLQQDVAAWQKFLSDATDATTTLGSQLQLGISSDLLGAKLMGRFPSGCPVMIDGGKENIKMPFRNDFDFNQSGIDSISADINKTVDNTKNAVCPLGAHIRKTNPRLNSKGDRSRILRRGIPYGEDFQANVTTDKNRGLLFACYQSNIEDGFQFIQKSWANAPNFPSVFPGVPKGQCGLDMMMGQSSTNSLKASNVKEALMDITIPSSGSTGQTKTTSITQTSGGDLLSQFKFVTTIWGEYFFLPPFAALTGILAGKGAPTSS